MVRRIFWILSLIVFATIIYVSLYVTQIWWTLFIVVPIFLIGVYDIFQTKHAILRNYPVIGHLRYFFESIRPEIMQYFVETDTEGRPFDRVDRSLVYQRAKNETETTPFGTQENIYESGYEWINHSLYAKSHHDHEIDTRVLVGGKDCKQPYSASILNVSAMSFGSLSNRAIESLNGGSKIGNFAHNTGEGGISPYHLKHGGDLIWQVGTGYFGCRAENGGFSPEKFKVTVSAESVKMIEIKLSQGAKPGHGGILPASKNTVEIAKIRGVKPHTAVLSPPVHSAFGNPEEFMQFIKQLRDLSGGKPIGFKLCIGIKKEFEELCEAMVSTGITPDFIAIDGGEGGTGAAPVEFSDSVGTPFLDGLSFAHNTLVKFGLRDKLKISASGKIVTGFHLVRAIALGADFCQSARAMMLSVGCIQARICNNNKCPVGVATQDPKRVKAINVADKIQRVASYQIKTVASFSEILLAAGLTNKHQLTRSHINHRVEKNKVLTYEDIYPSA